MSYSNLINYTEAKSLAMRHIQNNRMSNVQIENEVPFLHNIPESFSMNLFTTKAAIKRGVVKNAFGFFERDQWFSVILSEPTTLWGKPSTRYYFQINPSYKKEIEDNLEVAQYEVFMNLIRDYESTSLPTLELANVLTGYWGWDTRNKVQKIVNHFLWEHYDSHCSRMTDVVHATFNFWVYAESLIDEPQCMPSVFNPLVRNTLKNINHIIQSIQHPDPMANTVSNLDRRVAQHISQ